LPDDNFGQRIKTMVSLSRSGQANKAYGCGNTHINFCSRVKSFLDVNISQSIIGNAFHWL
jgi:hypothetical protein